jgi:hypothetical protein
MGHKRQVTFLALDAEKMTHVDLLILEPFLEIFIDALI